MLSRPSLKRLKAQLDPLLVHYRTLTFIDSDPMRYAAKLRDKPLEAELSAFICAVLSYGRRELILEMLDELHDRIGGSFYQYLETFSEAQAQKDCRGFLYRFQKSGDIVWLLKRLADCYNQYDSLEACFLAAAPRETSLAERLDKFGKVIIGEAPKKLTYGQRYSIPLASTGGACKRLHLFLRWVVRDDADLKVPIDLGLWTNALRPSELIMPLDTHVGQLSRELGLTERKTNDWKTAEEITAVFRQLNPVDPTLYDFALLGYGVDRRRQQLASKGLQESITA